MTALGPVTRFALFLLRRAGWRQIQMARAVTGGVQIYREQRCRCEACRVAALSDMPGPVAPDAGAGRPGGG